MERRRKSLIWTTFTELEGSKAKCGLCSTIISFSGGATSNLSRHLRTKHPGAQFARQPVMERRDEEIIDIPASSEQPSTSSTSATLVPNSLRSDEGPSSFFPSQYQRKITSFISRPLSMEKNKQTTNW